MYIRCQSLNYSVLVRHIRAPVNDPPQIFSLWYILNSANRSSFVGVAPCFMGSNLTLPPLPRFARFTRFARHLRRASGCCKSARLRGCKALWPLVADRVSAPLPFPFCTFTVEFYNIYVDIPTAWRFLVWVPWRFLYPYHPAPRYSALRLRGI